MSHMELLRSAWQKQERINTINQLIADATMLRDDCASQIESQRNRQAQFSAEKQSLEKTELEINEKIQTASKAKARTALAMETGAAYDYATAETQLKAYAERIDALEDEALICMDDLDRVTKQLGIAVESIRHATQKYGEAHAGLSRLEIALEPEKEELESAIVQEVAQLPREWEGYFQRARHTHKKLVVELRGKNCGHCGILLPAQSVSELKRLQRPFSCRLCKAILVSFD